MGIAASSPENEGWFKANLVDIANQHMTAPIKQPCCLRREHYDAIKELRQMNDLVFLKPDKGSGVVVMNRQTYTTKTEVHTIG